MTPDTPRPDEAERRAADELSLLGQEMRLDEGATCALCGHAMTLARCGSAGTTDPDGTPIRLCHTDDHDCYHLVTVYKVRPGATTNRPYNACWGPDVDA